jgi:hypothetical protein
VVASSLIDLLARTLRDGVDLRSTTSLLDAVPDWLDTSYHAAPLLERLRREAKFVPAKHASGIFGAKHIVVGASTWRPFQPPAAWKRGNLMRAIHFPGTTLRAQGVVDLGDGTFLAGVRCGAPYIVRLVLADIETRPLENKAVHIESSQPLASIPVLGRSVVDVLTYALDHAQLPRPVGTLADVDARRVR